MSFTEMIELALTLVEKVSILQTHWYKIKYYTLLTINSLNHDYKLLSLLANIEGYGSNGKGNLHNDLFVERDEMTRSYD